MAVRSALVLLWLGLMNHAGQVEVLGQDGDDDSMHLSGQVVDEQGEPIRGVYVDLFYTLPSGRLMNLTYPAITNAEGRWQAVVEKEASPGSLRLIHPDYISHHFDKPGSRRVDVHQLREGTHVSILKWGERITGTVRNSEGQPVLNALIVAGDSISYLRDGHGIIEDATTARTSADGSFSIGGILKGPRLLFISAEGYAPREFTLSVTENMPPADITLIPGTVYPGRVVDKQGRPIEGANVTLRSWMTTSHHNLRRETTTDGEGGFRLEGLPEYGTLEFMFSEKDAGHVGLQVPVQDLDQWQRIVLSRLPTITGQVVDADTGQPIPEFQLISSLVRPSDDPKRASFNQLSSQAVHSQDGTFQQSDHRFGVYLPFDYLLVLSVTAAGYYPAYTPPVALGEEAEPCEVQMRRGVSVASVVEQPDGSPASGATVGWVGKETGNYAFVRGWQLDHSFGMTSRWLVQADDNGRFELLPNDEDEAVFAIHESGYAYLPRSEVGSQPTIRLAPWARVTGTLHAGDAPIPNEQISLWEIVKDPGQVHEVMPGVFWNHNHGLTTRTQDDGTFVFEHVPVLPSMVIGRRIGWQMSHVQAVTPVAGQVTRVDIGGDGRAVTGRIELPPSDEVDLSFLAEDHAQEHVYAFARPARPTPEEKMLDVQYVPVFIDTETFRIDDLKPGAYELRIDVYAPRAYGTCGRGLLLATGTARFDVPDDGEDGAVELAPLVLGKPPLPKVGDEAPDFTGRMWGGGNFYLRGRRDVHVVLHFWATSRGPCMAEMAEVGELRAQYADNDKIKIVGVNLDDDPEQAKRAIAAGDLGEPQILMGPWKDNELCRLYGVTALPSHWLIGPDGRVLLANGTLADLASALEGVVEGSLPGDSISQ